MTISVRHNPLLALTELYSLFIFCSWVDLLELHTDRECSRTTAVYCGSVFCGNKTFDGKWGCVYNWGLLDRRWYWKGAWLKKLDRPICLFTSLQCFLAQQISFSSRVAALVHLTSCVTLNQFLKGQDCSVVLCGMVMQNC